MNGAVLLAALSLDGSVVRAGVRARKLLAGAAPDGIFAPPARAARLLARGEVSGAAILWRAELAASPDRRGRLAAPFVPPDGRRSRFRLVSARETPEGMLAVYRIAGR